MKLVALCEVYYAGTTYKPGEEFEADDRDGVNVRILIGLEKVKKVEALETRAMKAEEPIVEPPADDTSPKRRYKRRDLAAED